MFILSTLFYNHYLFRFFYEHLPHKLKKRTKIVMFVYGNAEECDRNLKGVNHLKESRINEKATSCTLKRILIA